jgi:hypothetical protein
MITKEQILSDPAKYLKEELVQSLTDQGHNNSGRLAESLEVEIGQSAGIMKATIKMLDYGLVIETGVPASRVPFGGQRGQFSEYLQGLMDSYNWDLGTAIRVAKTAKIEGHPTDGSFVFSKTGKRTGFITEVLTNTQTLDRVAQIVLEKLVNAIN